jgi:site-specific DNA recombinase
VSPHIVEQIVTTLRDDQKHAASKVNAERARLEDRLTAVRNRVDAAYTDRFDGKITEEFWERKMTDWRTEEQRVKLALEGLHTAETEDRALRAERTLELANKAYLLYFSQDSFGKAKLLRTLLSNCSVDAVSATPAYRYPFDLIFKRARMEEWSGRLDSNQRPPAPEAGALPDCATPRTLVSSIEDSRDNSQRPPAGSPASD